MKNIYLISIAIIIGLIFAGSVTYAGMRISNPESVLTFITGGSSTAGSVIFSDGTNFAEDNSNLFWDDTNNRLGIGTLTPLQSLHVVGSQIITVDLDIFGGDLNIGTGSATSTLTSSSANLGLATTTPIETFSVTGNMAISSDATTTITIDATANDTGGCIEMGGADGTLYRIYIDLDTGTALKVEAGVCQ